VKNTQMDFITGGSNEMQVESKDVLAMSAPLYESTC